MVSLLKEVQFIWRERESTVSRQSTFERELTEVTEIFKYWREVCWGGKSWLLIMNKLYSKCLSCMNNLSDLRRAVMSSSWVIRVAARNTDHTLVRVLDHTLISAMSISAEVTSNLILAVLRCCTMILLTLVASHNTAFLRVDIDIVILNIYKNVISYDKIDLGRGCKN